MLIVILLIISIVNCTSPHPVVIISLDGFRYDYYHRLQELTLLNNVTNYLQQVGAEGVSAPDGVANVFITSTFPNHYTLATGLYEESHGITDNSIYDPKLNETVYLGNTQTYSATQLASYYRGTPIWVNVVQQMSYDSFASYMWIGCGLPIANITLTHHVEFNATTNINCSNMIDWLRVEMTNNRSLIMMYHMEPDSTGHA